ncbi:hypothetical protein ACWU4D_05755 [Vibrio sp. WJH972]
MRLTRLENIFEGKILNQELIDLAKSHVSHEIQPMSDVRGSAQYRIKLVENLIQRYFYETQRISTRLVHHA